MPERFTERQRREIAGRARTLHERLERPANVSGPNPRVDPEHVIEEWRDQFPDEATFRERLEYEGLTADEVRDLIGATHWPPDEPLPDWISAVESLVGYVERSPSDEDDGFELSDDVPFRELFETIVAYARAQLSEEAVPADALSPLFRGLAKRLRKLCLRPLYVEFKSFVKHHDEELAYADPEAFDDLPRDYYRSFVDSMFEDGFRNLCLEYPVLARQLIHVVECWVEATAELSRRVESDRSALRETFDVDGDVTELTPLADDVHARGRMPIRVSFDEGDVVYKPRSVDCGIAFYEILDRFEDHLSTPAFRKPRYLSRDGYGWMESVDYNDLADDDAAQRYYHRAGALLCLAYVLNFPDCQFENVIVSGEQPTVIDCETLFHPHIDVRDREGSNEVGAFVGTSPLLTGLLPFVSGKMDEDAFGPPTGAGLGTDSEEKAVSNLSLPMITAANTDVMSVVEKSPTIQRHTNTPTVDGEDCPPSEYVDSLIDGFRDAHEAIRTLHADDRFFTSVVDSDLVDGIENRLMYRNTVRYSSILTATTTRRALQNGVRLSVEFEELAVPFFDGQIESDRWWPVYAAERRALRRRDVPRFSSSPGARAVVHDGDALGVDVDASGIERSRLLLDRLDESDLSRQVSLLRQTFDPAESGDLDTVTKPPEPTSVTDERLRREAIELFAVAVEAALEIGDEPGWVSPTSNVPMRLMPTEAPAYYGKSGIALAGAALYEATGQSRYRQLVDDLVRGIVDELSARGHEHGLGGLRGIGSIVYSLSVVSELVDESYRREALETTQFVTPDRLATDDAFDVMSGTAGALLGLLACYDRFGDDEVLERARDCGERLLEAREPFHGYEVWDTREAHDPVGGFAHGQCGIAYSLARLADVTNTLRYGSAAREALAYESERAKIVEQVEGHQTVPDQIPDWCRGRPGRALARLGIADHLGDETILAEARRNLAAVDSAEPAVIDNLCCGNLGRADVLLEGSRRLDDRFSGATELVGRCLARRERDGRLELPGHSLAYPNVSLFHGVSGAAYALLRHRRPDDLPCVLLLE